MPVIDTQQLTKLYYSIGEVADLLQVNASLLRFWEKEFELKVSKRNKKGNRLYAVKEIEKINKIYALVKVKLYTLDGAKQAMKSKDISQIYDAKQMVVTKLERIKQDLLNLKS
ncbi:MAG: MerR family transcriptional regulator [Crocinitomicaceae bacterium]|nr:MerR family transcriptional regulator [Crocinitomicaceae bacterium]MDG1351398.1 MerR family transcriptional regulator [Crocinitomicaceae bacterium]MDG1734417.1 MerR family transcriptional regulator [Crocinitomicaceae bacterium]MDG2505076.1 MerR family transcriptional regulator [Crocinitomicaceae bacterium]